LTAGCSERAIEAYPYVAAFRPGRELRYRFNWNAPVLVSSHDPEVIYHPAQVVLKSTDRGQSWTAISPDLTRNDLQKQGTTGGPIMIEGAGGEHYGTIMDLAESPHDPGTLWTAANAAGRAGSAAPGGGRKLRLLAARGRGGPGSQRGKIEHLARYVARPDRHRAAVADRERARALCAEDAVSGWHQNP
jgi:hypothetical protein